MYIHVYKNTEPYSPQRTPYVEVIIIIITIINDGHIASILVKQTPILGALSHCEESLLKKLQLAQNISQTHMCLALYWWFWNVYYTEDRVDTGLGISTEWQV